MSEDGRAPDPEGLSETTRVTVADGVLSREVDGETVLVHLERGVYFGLDEVGTRIWQWMGEHGRLDRVLAEVLEAYEVDEATAREDLLRLVNELREQQLLTVDADEDAGSAP